MEHILGRSMFPIDVQYQDVTLQQWEVEGKTHHPEAFETVIDWVQKFPFFVASRSTKDRLKLGRGLVLSGPPGGGKTMLAAGLLNFIEEHKYRTAWLPDRILSDLLREQRFTSLDDGGIEVMDLLENIHCVVIDDMLRLGGDQTLVEAYLRRRHSLGRPTIITLNNLVDLNEVMRSFLSNWTWAFFGDTDFRPLMISDSDPAWNTAI